MADKVTKYKSKKFRVAVEGATTDGRVIDRSWIEQMAKNYDAKKYGARINIEHIKGYHPDSAFRAMGDVLSLSTETFKDGDKEKLALVAEIEPTKELADYVANKQKIYTSVEINTKFADSGEAYLVGLAVTDSPASLGTEMLQFSSTAASNPLAPRKTTPDCVFSAAEEISLTIEEESESLTEKIKALFNKGKAETNEAVDKFKQDAEGALTELATEISQLKTQFAAHGQAGQSVTEKLDALTAEFSALKANLSKETNDYRHAPATGGDEKQHQTDC